MTSAVEAASLNNAKILRFEAFATIVTFGVMSSWNLVGSCYRFGANCYANFVVDVEDVRFQVRRAALLKIQVFWDVTLQMEVLRSCEISGTTALTTRLYIPEDLEDRRDRLFRNISDHVPECTVSPQ